MSACAQGLTSCPGTPGPNSRSHLCYSTDSSVCPSKARTIKGSFQSHCRRNVNIEGRPAVVSEVECHLWAASKAAGSPGAWGLDLLLPQTCCAIFGIFLTFSGPCFYHQRKERVGLNLKALNGSSIPKMFSVLCCGSGGQCPDSPIMTVKYFMQQFSKQHHPQPRTWIFFKTSNNIAIEAVKLFINIS